MIRPRSRSSPPDPINANRATVKAVFISVPPVRSRSDQREVEGSMRNQGIPLDLSTPALRRRAAKPSRELAPRVDGQLLVDPRQVRLNGLLAQEHRCGDLAIREPFSHPLGDLRLCRGQLVRAWCPTADSALLPSGELRPGTCSETVENLSCAHKRVSRIALSLETALDDTESEQRSSMLQGKAEPLMCPHRPLENRTGFDQLTARGEQQPSPPHRGGGSPEAAGYRPRDLEPFDENLGSRSLARLDQCFDGVRDDSARGWVVSNTRLDVDSHLQILDRLRRMAQ